MGQVYTYPKHPAPQLGCWWYYMTTSPHNFNLYFSNPRQYDCDCRPIGHCPAGPPPHPPIMEFVAASNPQHADELPMENPKPVENDDWEEGFDFDLITSEEYNKHHQRKVRRAVTRNDASQSYLDAAVEAFYKLPIEKQEELVNKYGPSTRFSVSGNQQRSSSESSLSRNATSKVRNPVTADRAEEKINQHLALSTFLSNPSSVPNLSKNHKPSDGEYVIHCVSHAFKKLAKHGPVAPAVTLPLGMNETAITVLESQDNMYSALNSIISKPWRLEHKHLPHWLIGRPAEEPVPVNPLCDALWNDALDNVRQPEHKKRYIGSIDDIMDSLEATSWAAGYSNVTHQADTLKQLAPLLGHVDWDDGHAKMALGEAYPATIVGLSYLTMSMYAAPGMLTL